VDLVPTVLDLMGITPVVPLDGVSRAPSLRNPAQWRREDICVEWNDPEEAALSGRSRVTADGWKLNLYHDDTPELFDLNTDPGERVNLAGSSSQRDRIRRLTDDVRSWQQTHRDSLSLRT
jgi:arylsulfatase A-like enzyme